MGDVPRGLVISDAVADRRQTTENDGEEARHVAERRGARLRPHGGRRRLVRHCLAAGALRLGMEARVPERDGSRSREGG